MLADKFVQLLAGGGVFEQREFHHVHVAEVVESSFRIPDVGHAAAHARSKVAARLSQYNDTTSGHVLAAVIAHALDDGNGARVAHGEAFARSSVDVDLAAGSTIEQGVARDGILFGGKVAAYGWQH